MKFCILTKQLTPGESQYSICPDVIALVYRYSPQVNASAEARCTCIDFGVDLKLKQQNNIVLYRTAHRVVYNCHNSKYLAQSY